MGFQQMFFLNLKLLLLFKLNFCLLFFLKFFFLILQEFLRVFQILRLCKSFKLPLKLFISLFKLDVFGQKLGVEPLNCAQLSKEVIIILHPFLCISFLLCLIFNKIALLFLKSANFELVIIFLCLNDTGAVLETFLFFSFFLYLLP